MSTDIKLSKGQISKIIQFGRFLVSLLSKLASPLMKVAVPLAKNVLGITAAASAIDARIQKNTWFREYDLLKKWRNERHNENFSNPWEF